MGSCRQAPMSSALLIWSLCICPGFQILKTAPPNWAGDPQGQFLLSAAKYSSIRPAVFNLPISNLKVLFPNCDLTEFVDAVSPIVSVLIALWFRSCCMMPSWLPQRKCALLWLPPRFCGVFLGPLNVFLHKRPSWPDMLYSQITFITCTHLGLKIYSTCFPSLGISHIPSLCMRQNQSFDRCFPTSIK